MYYIYIIYIYILHIYIYYIYLYYIYILLIQTYTDGWRLILCLLGHPNMTHDVMGSQKDDRESLSTIWIQRKTSLFWMIRFLVLDGA